MYQLYLNEKRHWLEMVRRAETADPSARGVQAESAHQAATLPDPVQRYLKMAGFADRPLPKAGEVIWKESRIKFGPDKPWTSLKTLQFNATPSPVRMAYMTTKMFGVLPFEGRDLFADGQGHMLGKIAGMIPVFDDRCYANPNGVNERQTWTAYCENYIEKDGVRFPSTVRAVWSLSEGEFEYWNGTVDRVVYDIKE